MNWRWGWVRNWEPPGKMDGSHRTVQYFIMCRKLVVLCISTLDPKSDSEAGWWHEKCSRPRGGSVEQWVAIFFLHLPSASAWETCYLGISSKEWQVHHPCLTILNNSCMVPISPFHFEQLYSIHSSNFGFNISFLWNLAKPVLEPEFYGGRVRFRVPALETNVSHLRLWNPFEKWLIYMITTPQFSLMSPYPYDWHILDKSPR